MAQFNFQAGPLTKWLGDLPRGSIGKTAELLYKALQEINQQEIKATERFRILETIREPIHYVTENMRTHFSTMTIPPSEKTALIIDACRAFYAGMAESYQLAIRDCDDSQGIFTENKIKLIALHRAHAYIGHALLTAYQVYATSHHQNWGKLHTLYTIAERAGMTDTPVTDEVEEKRKSTITEEYLRILLLSMTSPYNLRQGEIGRIFHYLDGLCGLVTIGKLSDQTALPAAGMPVVNLATDYPPELAGPTTVIEDRVHYRLINTTRLLDKLKAELEELREPNKKSGKSTLASQYEISADLLRRLIESWGYLKKRKFQRRQVMAPIHVGIGLYNTHHLLLLELTPPSAVAGAAHNAGFDSVTKYQIDIVDVNKSSYDIWASVYPGMESQPDAAQQTITASASPKEATYEHTDKQWTLLNQSAEGFGLMCLFNCGDKLQVGELVCIHNEGVPAEKKWSVGIIKWLKSYGKNGIEIGGQMLAPIAIPVGITSMRDKKDAFPTRGLLLPELPNINRPGSIICSSKLYRVGDILLIKQLGNTEIKVQLTRLTGSNNIINQFLFTLVGQNNGPAHDVEEPSIEIDIRKFKDVWNSI